MDDDRREPLQVLVFAASLRADSINSRLGQLAASWDRAALDRPNGASDHG